MIIGIDLGNEVTKTSNFVSFASRIKLGHHEMNKDDLKVEYNGVKYTAGTGTPVLGMNRINSDMYEVCLLTAIARSSKDDVIETNIVVGLPPEQFDSPIKTELKEKLNRLGQKEIIVYEDNKPVKKIIRISKADVFSESSIIFQEPKKFRDKKTIICDIGGGTTDISQFNGLNREDFTTTDLGMIKLFKAMKTKVNGVCMTKFNEDDMFDFIGSKAHDIRGVKTDISFLEPIIKDHVRKICNKINAFDIDNSSIILIGGGAKPLAAYFENEYNSNIEVYDNSQFANALTYEAVGVMLWNV